jgi:hypothetical protein
MLIGSASPSDKNLEASTLITVPVVSVEAGVVDVESFFLHEMNKKTPIPKTKILLVMMPIICLYGLTTN